MVIDAFSTETWPWLLVFVRGGKKGVIKGKETADQVYKGCEGAVTPSDFPGAA
jgi:hypothetical protein